MDILVRVEKLEKLAEERAHLINFKSYLALSDRITELEKNGFPDMKNELIAFKIERNELKERMFNLEQRYVHCLDGIEKCFERCIERGEKIKKELEAEIEMRKDLRDYCFDVLAPEIENMKSKSNKTKWDTVNCKMCLRYLGDCSDIGFNPTSQFSAICNDCLEKNKVLNGV